MKDGEAIITQLTALAADFDALQVDGDAITAQLTAINAQLTELNDGYPAGATPFYAEVNGTAVAAAATPQTVLAAGGAGIRYYITEAIFWNITGADVAVLKLQDEDDAVITGPFAVGDPAAGEGYLHVKPKSPFKQANVNKALEVACIGDVGDSYCQIWGYSIDES